MHKNCKLLVILTIIICSIYILPTESYAGSGGFSFGSSGSSASSVCDGRTPSDAPEAGSIDNEDDTYRNLSIVGSEYQGTRAKGAISHKVTNNFSSLEVLNPWYFVNLQNPDKEVPYLGPIYRGNQNEHRIRSRMTQILSSFPRDTVNTCKRVIEPAGGNPDYYDPVWARMEMDNCANQYILIRARQSRVGFEEQGQLPFLRQKKDSLCQPLRLIPVEEDEQEYLPSDYILYAWMKLLYDETYMLRGGATEMEPDYSELGVKVAYPILPPTSGQQDYNKDEEGLTPASDYAFGLTCINDLTEKQVERILDPSHPFTPRWDFESNERDKYSIFTAQYSKDPINYVRCAGEKMTNIIKTDILSFRAEYFHKNIMMRIITNIICYNIIVFNRRVCWLDAWECDDNTQDNQTAGQCCATNFDGKDSGAMGGAARVVCGRPVIEDLCESITRAIPPVNTLKMRKAEDFANGIPQGHTFDQYFGNHRPYMRCWDTGMECSLTTGDSRHRDGTLTIEGLKDQEGSEYAIMGAGRENENCAIGGGSAIASTVNPGVTFLDIDPITNWAELKLYQARATREFGLGCLPKHEALFKQGSGEDVILSRTGAEYQKIVSADNSSKLTRPQSFSWPMSWRGYVIDPSSSRRFPNFGSGGGTVPISTGIDDAFPGDILIYDKDVVMSGAKGTWRNPYVAYVTDQNLRSQGGVGLEWVKVLAFNHGKFLDSCGNTDTWGQGEEFTIFKTEVPEKNLLEYEDYGYAGALGKITAGAGGRYSATMQNNCDDPLISSCIEPHWDSVKRYFPIDDPRMGN